MLKNLLGSLLALKNILIKYQSSIYLWNPLYSLFLKNHPHCEWFLIVLYCLLFPLLWNEYYDLGDQSSNIVNAFKSSKPELFFSEKKSLFYLAIKSGNYVICFHYPADTFWTEQNVQQLKMDIFRDIIETEPALFRNFAIQLLGGIK